MNNLAPENNPNPNRDDNARPPAVRDNKLSISEDLSASFPGTFRRPPDLESLKRDVQVDRAPSNSREVANVAQSKDLTVSKQGIETSSSSHESYLTTTWRTLKACKNAILSTFCYSGTGVLTQGARIGLNSPSEYPNSVLFSAIRSAFACVATFPAARAHLGSLGGREWGMAALAGTALTLWAPAFMFTDLASAMVIGFSAPLLHAGYELIAKKKLPTALTSVGLGLTVAALYSIHQAADQAGPMAMLGNACAMAATGCLAAYRIMVNNTPKEDRPRLDALSFASNSFAVGLGLAIAPFLSGGLGPNAVWTLSLAALQGVLSGAAIHFNTRANQELSPVSTSLISSFQVGLTPALGFFIWGSTVPGSAIVGGILTFGASILAVGDRWLSERRKRAGA